MNVTRMVGSTLATPLALLAFTSGAHAQAATASQQEAQAPPTGTEVLTIDDYALWRGVGQTSISPDGRWGDLRLYAARGRRFPVRGRVGR